MKVLIVGAGKAGALNKTTRLNGQIIYRNHLDVLLKLKTSEINIVDNSLSVLRKLKRKIKSTKITLIKLGKIILLYVTEQITLKQDT